jgi:hypothetical protein
MKIHPMTRTAPQIRAEIRTSPLSRREKARRYNVSRATIRKWEKRDDVQDRSHRPRHMATSLTEAQEIILLETTLMRYLAAYNHHIPQRALAHRTPVQAIEEWMLKKSDSIRFVPVYDQAGLDTLRIPARR